MMRHVLDFFTGSPVPLVLAGSHFLCYSLPAWCVLIVRAASGRFSRKEWGLFFVFVGCIGLEILQLAVDGFKFFGKETWGVPRYFGVFAPLLWLWAAYALSEMWGRAKGWLCIALRCVIVVAFLWLVSTQDFDGLYEIYHKGARYDAVVAAERISGTIRRDYAGPARQKEAKPQMHEYFTTRRPVVFGDFAAAAWMVRGQSEGAIQGRGLCPYPDDYLFIRVGSGYGGMNTVDSRLYDYVRSVRGGLGAEWRLFRRKTTPHKDMTDARRLNQRPRTY